MALSWNATRLYIRPDASYNGHGDGPRRQGSGAAP